MSFVSPPNLTGGMGKRAWNSGFAGGMGKRSAPEEEFYQDQGELESLPFLGFPNVNVKVNKITKFNKQL